MDFYKLAIVMLLFFCCGKASAQYNPAKTDAWLDNHAAEMGGRVVLMVWQNGQVVYSHAVNAMNNNQKRARKFMARRQGTTAELNDFSSSSREPIASCSKWLSAALVMTFVDEG